GLERKRRAIWHNDARNDLVTGVVQALLTRNRERLAEYGIDVGEEDFPEGKNGLKVTVLVESTEHGKELLARLPTFEMF
ncbi:hypothetical protein ACO1LX_20355, partial [Staphylococcus aureus]